jgi:hypothetical protein
MSTKDRATVTAALVATIAMVAALDTKLPPYQGD